MLNRKSGTASHRQKKTKSTDTDLIKPDKPEDFYKAEEPETLKIPENVSDNELKKTEVRAKKPPENNPKPKKSIFKKLKDVYNRIRRNCSC